MPRKKPTEQGQGCVNCLHWQELTQAQDEVRHGVCRRFPPVIVSVTDEEGNVSPCAIQPPTDPQDLCGEWKAGQ